MNLNPLSSNYLRNVGGLTKVKKTTKTPTKTPNITHKHSHSPYKQAKPNPTRYRGYYSTMLATSFELQGP